MLMTRMMLTFVAVLLLIVPLGARTDPWVNVTVYGATPNVNTDDDWQAITNALNAAGPRDRVYFPPGVYRISKTLSVSDKTVSITGAGAETTELRFYGEASHGLVITHSGHYSNHFTTIRDIAVTTERQGMGDAIRIVFPPTTSINEPHATIENVTIRPYGHTDLSYWVKGIYLEGVWYPRLRGISVHGRNRTIGNPDVIPGTRGIHFAGKTKNPTLKDFVLYFLEMGILVTHDTESPMISHGEIVGSEWGVYVNTNANMPGFFLSDTHINTDIHGILLNNHPQGTIRGNLFYKSGTSTANYIAVQVLSSSPDIVIEGNTFVVQGGSTGGQDGIVVHSANCIVSNNRAALLAYAGVGVWLTSTSSGVIATNNRSTNGTPNTPVLNQGTNNLVVNNK